jgi:hypothetical protein
MLQSGIRATTSTLDPYGPRTNVNLSKFVIADFGLCKFGKNWEEIRVKSPNSWSKFMIE